MGLGVVLLIMAGYGADGFSMLIRGLSLKTGLPYWSVNVAVGLLITAAAWLRGMRPGLSTFATPLLAGVTVSLLLPIAPDLEGVAVRSLCLLAALPVCCAGIAAYLAADYGAGPAEAAALAFSPPIPVAATLATVQIVGAVAGWLMGATLGIGTALVVVIIGPLVAWFSRFFPVPQDKRLQNLEENGFI